MKRLRYLGFLTAGVATTAAVNFLITQPPPASWVLAGVFAGVAGYATMVMTRPEQRVIMNLKGMRWTREDFCRSWLITGDTGSGKTRPGITPLLYQVFQNEPGWGGLCIDDKGIKWETLSEMARHFNRSTI